MASKSSKKTGATKKVTVKKPVLRKRVTKVAITKPRAAKPAPKPAAKPKSKVGKQTVSRRVSTKNQRDKKGKFLPGNSLGKQFKVGQSGNPNGRTGSITDAIRQRLPAVRVETDGRTNAQLVADMLLEEAIEKKNIQAAREVLDRIEGKPRQTLDLTVIKSETEKYENMILQYIESSKADGFDVSKEEAISYLAQHDPRILELFPLSSEATQ